MHAGAGLTSAVEEECVEGRPRDAEAALPVAVANCERRALADDSHPELPRAMRAHEVEHPELRKPVDRARGEKLGARLLAGKRGHGRPATDDDHLGVGHTASAAIATL